MKIPVYMFAFADQSDRSEIRSVEIPDEEYKITQDATYPDTAPEVLELVFKYGQNDFQPQERPSVSVGDVAVVNGRYFLCMSVGWKEIDKEEFNSLTPPTSFYAMKKGLDLL